MQRHIPIGYCIQDGKAVIQPETARIVKRIFHAYLNGTSTYQIAKKLTEHQILNANGKPSWNHGSVGRILENYRYLGDELYPSLIENDIFEKVQNRRKKKAEELGRTAQINSLANRSIWSRLLICGECGQPYHKYTEKGRPTKWKCKHYIYQNRVFCRNDFLDERALEEAFVQVINRVIGNPDYLKDDFPPKLIPESLEENRLDGKINELLSGSADAQRIKELAYKRASASYRKLCEDNRAYHNKKLVEILKDIPLQTGCNLTLLEQTIDRIVVRKQTGLDFYLKNGRNILIPAKEGR